MTRISWWKHFQQTSPAWPTSKVTGGGAVTIGRFPGTGFLGWLRGQFLLHDLEDTLDILHLSPCNSGKSFFFPRGSATEECKNGLAFWVGGGGRSKIAKHPFGKCTTLFQKLGSQRSWHGEMKRGCVVSNIGTVAKRASLIWFGGCSSTLAPDFVD